MAKDPAFLFYPSDFLTGTMFMTDAEVGKYTRLICAQHQHGGIIDKVSFNAMVGENQIIRSKFIETETGFYNERLTIEMDKRNKKSNNMSETAKEVWKNRKLQLYKDSKEKEYKSNTIVKKKDTNVIQPVNVNEDVIVNKDKIEILTESQNVLIFLNETANRMFDYKNKNSLSEINARLKDGYTSDELNEIIQMKTMEWVNDDKMKKYLTPDTLFNPKNCAKYREQLKQVKLNPEQFKNSINAKSGYPKTQYTNGTTPFDDWGK